MSCQSPFRKSIKLYLTGPCLIINLYRGFLRIRDTTVFFIDNIRLYFLINAIKSSELVILCFCSKKDAARFKRFNDRFIDETGAGNGYLAYWIKFGCKISSCEDINENFVTTLKKDLVLNMLSSILIARTASINPTEIVDYAFGQKNGAIIF